MTNLNVLKQFSINEKWYSFFKNTYLKKSSPLLNFVQLEQFSKHR